MKMMLKKVGEPVKEVDLPDKYETTRDVVGGYIEAVYLEHDVICWINEEGKLIGLKPNFNVDCIAIVGDALFTGQTKGGDNKALTKEQIAYVYSLFAEKELSPYQKFIDETFAKYDLPLEIWTYTGEQNGVGIVQTIDSLSALATLRNIEEKPLQMILKMVIEMMMMSDDKDDLMGLLKATADDMAKHGLR